MHANSSIQPFSLLSLLSLFLSLPLPSAAHLVYLRVAVIYALT